jgi:hypothetical protein
MLLIFPYLSSFLQASSSPEFRFFHCITQKSILQLTPHFLHLATDSFAFLAISGRIRAEANKRSVKMKKTMKHLVTIAIVALAAGSMIGCGANAELLELESLISRNTTVLDQLDTIDTADLADSSLDDLAIGSSPEIVTLSSIINLEGELTDQEKVILIRGLMVEVRTLHENSLTLRETVRTHATEFRTTLQAFRAEERTLDETQRAEIESAIAELKTIRGELADTLGLAYRKLHDLRGKYTRENIDLVLNTYQDVVEVLQLRYDKTVRIDELVVAMNTLLS